MEQLDFIEIPQTPNEAARCLVEHRFPNRQQATCLDWELLALAILGLLNNGWQGSNIEFLANSYNNPIRSRIKKAYLDLSGRYNQFLSELYDYGVQTTLGYKEEEDPYKFNIVCTEDQNWTRAMSSWGNPKE